MDRLKGKVALISGGARGQGAAEARLLVGEGAKVVVGDVLDDQARALADEINKKAGARVLVACIWMSPVRPTRAPRWKPASANSAAWTSWSIMPASRGPVGSKIPPRKTGTRSSTSTRRASGWG